MRLSSRGRTWIHSQIVRRNNRVIARTGKKNGEHCCNDGDAHVSQESTTPSAWLVDRPYFRRGADRFDESVTLPRNGLDISRNRALVAQDRSEPADDHIKAVRKVDVPVGPQSTVDFVPTYS